MEDHLPDEGVLTIPEAWRRSLHARRGGAPGPRIAVDAAAPKTVRALVGETGASTRHLDAADDPAGAAAVAAATVRALGGPNRRDEVHRAFVDAWVTERGVAFAACALVELGRREDGKPEYLAPETVRRVRGLLAAAGDGEYDEAVERLAGHRTTTGTKWLVSYLVPARHDWVDECCTIPYPEEERSPLRWMALSALGKTSQLGTSYGLYWGEPTRALLTTLVDGIGPGLLDFLLDEVDAGHLEAAGGWRGSRAWRSRSGRCSGWSGSGGGAASRRTRAASGGSRAASPTAGTS